MFYDEESIARLLNSQAESAEGLNPAFLYATEDANSSEYEDRTLRVNAEELGLDKRGTYPGTLYTADEIDDNIWISFEGSEKFPESRSAQSILTEDPARTPSGQVVHYTHAPIDGLEKYSSEENEIRGLDVRTQGS